MALFAIYQPDAPGGDSGSILTVVGGTPANATLQLTAYEGAALCPLPDGSPVKDTTHRIENGAPVPL
ncbi:hypothetical protein IWC96_14465 [Brevundimonas sp. BAL450]|uniref:hypothetical protein n=1 Tax=Brevundimonas sp. BAL450 TaxID=1708162 RepID=UPI0018CAC86F|nr:hypothetical protein [Brevundimonas sp. BAL450]MBG7616478.1 hypothetical protein [Brevundimonas sp. BAL450]